MKLEEICKFCKDEEFEFRGIQKIELNKQEVELELYVCSSCKGHELYLFKGKRLYESSFNELY